MTAGSEVETCNQPRTPSPQNRKRQLSGDAPRPVVQAKLVKKAAPAPAKVANSGWGELFKNKEHFAEMHIC